MARGWVDTLTLETFVVHLKSGSQSFKGVLAAVHDDCLVLRDVIVLEPDSQVSLAGEIIIPRDNVDFLQSVTGGNA